MAIEMKRMRKVNRDQKLLKQATVLSIMAIIILFQIASIVVYRGNSGSIMDMENQFHYALKEEQSHDGMLSTSFHFATFPKEQVIKKPHAILFVGPDRMTTHSVQGFFSEVAHTLAESSPLGKGYHFIGELNEGSVMRLSTGDVWTDFMNRCVLRQHPNTRTCTRVSKLIRNLAKHNENLFISSTKIFSISNETKLEQIATSLSDYNVTLLMAHQHYPDVILTQYLSEYEGYMRRIRKDFTFPSLKEYIETKSGNVKEESIDNVFARMKSINYSEISLLHENQNYTITAQIVCELMNGMTNLCDRLEDQRTEAHHSLEFYEINILRIAQYLQKKFEIMQHVELKTLIDTIKDHHSKISQCSSVNKFCKLVDFPISCLSKNKLSHLIESSKSNELPTLAFDEKSVVRRMVMSKHFCWVEEKELIEKNEVWRSWSEDLNKTYSTNHLVESL